MRRSILIGHLRRLGLWGVGRRVHRMLARPICTLIHEAVCRLGPALSPTDLFLKHVYDYRMVFIDPDSVTTVLKAGAWPGRGDSGPRFEKLQRWLAQGGGWKTAQRHITRNFHGRFVAEGDWDAKSETFAALPVVTQLFQEGKAPEETDLYQRRLRKIEAGELAWTKGCRTQAELDQQFAELIRTFEAIRATGYRTQVELGRDGADEIRVCVDRQGRLCVYGGGTHRLAIAKLLKLPRVPVIIGRVHALWVDAWMRELGTSDIVAAVAEGVKDLVSASSSESLQG